MSWCRNMICGNLAKEGQEYCDTCQSMYRKTMGEPERARPSLPLRQSYSREEMIQHAKEFVSSTYGQTDDNDRKYLVLGVLVDFIHDRFPSEG